MYLTVAQLIEEGEQKITHMAKSCTSLGGPAVGPWATRSSRSSSFLSTQQYPQVISRGSTGLRIIPPSFHTPKSCCGVYSDGIFLITPTALLSNIHTSIGMASEPPLRQTTGSSPCFNPTPSCFSQHNPFPSSQAGYGACASLENVPAPGLTFGGLNLSP